jgi:hypothetical protein
LIRSASEANGVTVTEVEFGAYDREAGYSWLCYIADPAADNYVASMTVTSANDHLKRYDPNGFVTRNQDARLSITVHELETSSEAPFVLIGQDGQDVLTSPWVAHQVVVRATFNYRPS